MDEDEANARIIHSRRVLIGWREMSPAGPVEETLGLVADEIDVLERLSAEHPDRAGTIGLLILDWRNYAEALRAKAH